MENARCQIRGIVTENGNISPHDVEKSTSYEAASVIGSVTVRACAAGAPAVRLTH